MAEAVVGATIQVVLENVISFAADRVGMYSEFNEDLEHLRDSANTIKALLDDAEAKQGQKEPVKLWLKKLEGIAFEADHVFDELNYDTLRRQVKSQNQQQQQQFKGKGKGCFFFSFSDTKFAFRWRMASKIRDINTKLKKINQQATEFGLQLNQATEKDQHQVSTTAGATTSRQTDSVVVPNIVGRANDQSEIVEMLLSPSDKVVSVIPIVGMGGLGKTTLAKVVYNNSQIDEHFDEKGKKVWVCVAKEINIVDLFKLILGSLRRKTVKLAIRGAIVQEIKNELEGKRILLVLDDVWNQEESLWDDFFNTLKGLKPTNGSWCLVTTRLEGVANAMSGHLRVNDLPYRLQNLADDDCWSIIKGKVIAAEEIPEALKKQILRRCGGLPLAATLFGSLLAKGKEKWPSIVQKSLLDGDQNGVKQVIKVSFDYLSPASVKKCFAYCSIFPQDTGIKKDLLIELWMAEGFLQKDPKNERLMEDIGDDYFTILLQSSLLEEVKQWGLTRYKMHDLVHDFAKSALNEDRYLELNSSQGTAEDIIEKNTTSLRTLFLQSRAEISGDVLSKFECLHVLKLSGEDVKVLPASIGELIHLRILDISDSGITILPESLCKLYNLQTMRIKDRKLAEGLPEKMSDLISMRHLHYHDIRADFQMPSKMGRLTRLQTLEFFNVGQEDGRGIEELGSLKDLKGSLVIRNLELVNGKEGAEGAKLFEKPNLAKLELLWGSGDRQSDNCDESVLEGLQPPQKLQKLQIWNFTGDQFPGWFINLSTLVELSFMYCERCRELPALGQLPSLESLELNGLENIRSIGLSFYGISSGGGQVRKFFPALKYLSLEDMENLVEWKEDEERSTTGAAEVDLSPVLERLYIENCSQLTSTPSHFPSIELLDIRYNCRISLLKNIVSSFTALSSLELLGNMATDSHNDEYIESLHLEKLRYRNNLEGDVVCCLILTGCGSLPSEMLEHLSHLPSFGHLKLTGFSSLTRFVGQESFAFTSVEQLNIDYCNGLASLPGKMLESCASLQELNITLCDGLISLPGEMLVSCTSLQKLKIFGCGGLTSLPGKMLKSCAFLQELNITFCNGLTSLPGEMLEPCASLQKLKISDCEGLTSLPGEMLESCASLQKLKISDCDGLTSLPGEMLESCSYLWVLKVFKCPNLVSFPHNLQQTPDLEILYLSDCPKLMIADMPKGFAYLTSLKELWIGPFSYNETNEFDWSGLISSSSSTLTSLRFCGSPEVESLPEQLQYLTSLTDLDLFNCGIEALPDWFGKLASLETLFLKTCKKLRYLPSMAARRRLTKFESLYISGCPLLEERYNPQSGIDSGWPINL